ncbi:MAG TPA: diacylglycerol kinase family protein [Streptosporangiaceae bacterium]|nr:diacylglycerol kinase family protein [Streptosporangiaceae bacterium]
MAQAAVDSEPHRVGARNRARPWLAWLSFLLAVGAVAILATFGGLASLAMLAVGLASAMISVAAAFWFLADRGVRRWMAFGLLVASPLAVIVAFAFAGLLWVAVASGAAWLLAGVSARAALAPDPAEWRMPEYPAEPPPARPFFIMNPRSGGGKVAKFSLKRAAEELGATVFLMDGPGTVDVAEVARQAVADGADLLGVAGGDGTQALVANVAAECGIPFVVVTAGTRNHFALDLGLDRDNPAACLSALDDGVELRVDLGSVDGRTFVNNVSFGAYAEVVQTPAYRNDKVGSTLDLLPDLIRGQRGATLAARAGGVVIRAPQAVLVANNPYGTNDVAGLNRRARLDRGELGVIAVKVGSARQAIALLRRSRPTGLMSLTAPTVTMHADSPVIPVGIDGEAVTMPTPVHCSIRPGALRVRVPRNRPGVPPPAAPMDWTRLRRLALSPRSADPQPAGNWMPAPGDPASNVK